MRKYITPLIILLSVTILCVAPFAGAQQIPFSTLFEAGDETYVSVLYDLRIPRVMLGAIIGATLAVSGLIFQALFRNSLASPDMLGVSTGAAFGAVLFIRIGSLFTFSTTVPGISIAAFVGAISATSIIYMAASLKKGGMSEGTLLLAGIAMSYFFGSMSMVIQYASGFVDSFKMVRWSMGGLQAVGYSQIWLTLPALAAVIVAAYIYGPELNLFVCGEDIAASRGVSVAKMRKILFIVISFAVSLTVSACGPIGFVGLMVPHICRKLVGTDHRHTALASLFFGSGFLVFCDTFARTAWAPAEVPVGIITSSLGSLFFLVLLIKRKK